MYERYQTVPEDYEPDNRNMVTDEAIRKYIRKATGIPAEIDIEVASYNAWFTKSNSGEWYVDGPFVEIWKD